MERDEVLIMKHWLDKGKKHFTEDQMKDFLYLIVQFGFDRKRRYTNDTAINLALDDIYPQMEIMIDSYVESASSGKKGGRPKTVDDKEVWRLAREGKNGLEIARILGVNKNPVYRSEGWLQRDNPTFLETL